MPNNFSVARKSVIYLSLIMVIGLILRLYNLGTESFWFDEIFTVYLISQDYSGFVQQIITEGNNTRNIVYYLLIYLWMVPLELTEFSIRLPSAIFGLLAVGMMYIVGKNLFDAKIGIISSFLMAISEFQIHHSQEARFYSLFVLLTLMSIHYYTTAIKNNSRLSWFISSLVNLILFYTHSYAVFIFATEYIHYCMNVKTNKNTILRWSLSQIPILLAIVLSTFTMITKTDVSIGFGSGLAWISHPSIFELGRTIVSYILPRQHNHSWYFIWARISLSAIFLIVCIFFYRTKTKKKWINLNRTETWLAKFRSFKNPNVTLIILWFLMPIFVPFVFSFFSTPIFVDRYTICATPAFYLLIAYFMSRTSWLLPIFASIFALLIIILPGLQDYYSSNTNEQWREVASFVMENEETEDIIIFTPDDDGFQHKSFDWYYYGKIPFCSISSNIKDLDEIKEKISTCTLNHKRFWVILRGALEPTNRFSSFFLKDGQTDFSLIIEKKFVGISVYLFSIKK